MVLFGLCGEFARAHHGTFHGFWQARRTKTHCMTRDGRCVHERGELVGSDTRSDGDG